MPKYKWDSAYDWLSDAAAAWSAETLYQELMALAAEAGADAIQDRYQKDMADDGFFQDLDISKHLSREACVKLLTSIDIQCNDDEPVETLRGAVDANIEDGTLNYADVEAKVNDGK